MKPFYFFFCMLLVMSCSKSSNDSSSNPLQGTWKLIAVIDETGNGRKPDPTVADCPDCYVVTFNNDGTLTGKTHTNLLRGNYSFSAESSVLSIEKGLGSTNTAETADGELLIKVLTGKSICVFKNNLLKVVNQDTQNIKESLLFEKR